MRPPCPPFSPCWCEQHPNHPRCGDTPSLSIENTALSWIILTLIIVVVFKKFKTRQYGRR